MAWESRNGGGRYYTRSKRVNGRVVRKYIGGGLVGELAAAWDAEKRAKRDAKREAWNAEKRELDGIDGLLDRSSNGARELVRLTLVGAGYHRHHRGEWRRRRGAKHERE